MKTTIFYTALCGLLFLSCNNTTAENDHLMNYIETNEDNPKSFELVEKQLDTLYGADWFNREGSNNKKLQNEIESEKTNMEGLRLRLERNMGNQEAITKMITKKTKEIDSLKNKKTKVPSILEGAYLTASIIKYRVKNSAGNQELKEMILVESKNDSLIYAGNKKTSAKRKMDDYFSSRI